MSLCGGGVGGVGGRVTGRGYAPACAGLEAQDSYEKDVTIIIHSMVDGLHDTGHSVAVGASTLARRGATACAAELGAHVSMDTTVANVDDDARDEPHAKLWLCARFVLGHAAAHLQPRPVRAEARGLRSAAAGRMARRRRGERRRRSAQKIRGARPLLLRALRRAATSTAARQRRAARRRWARSRLELLVKVSTTCGGRRWLLRDQRGHRTSRACGGTTTSKYL